MSEEDVSFDSLPTLLIEPADDTEVQKLLELVDRIRQNYPMQ